MNARSKDDSFVTACFVACFPFVIASGCEQAPRHDPVLATTCGDGVVEGAERCDGDYLAGATCETAGFEGGVLRCSADCLSLDTAWCGATVSVSKTVGWAGDTLELDGARIDIPRYALDRDVLVELRRTVTTGVADARSALYCLMPFGRLAAHPLRVALPHVATAPALYFERLARDGYDRVPARDASGTLVSTLPFFSCMIVREATASEAMTYHGVGFYAQVPLDGAPVIRPSYLASDPPTLVAYWPDGAGGFGSASGAWSLGLATIAGVPAGASVWIRNGTEYILDPGGTFDLGSATGGAAPTGYSGSPATALVLDLTGLSPWAANDFLQLVSPAAGFAYNQFDGPPAGATALSGLAIPWQYQYLVDGQQLYVVQIGARAGSDGTPYYGAIAALAPPPFTMHDGLATTVSGELTAGTPGAFSATVPFEAYASLAPQVHPQASLWNVHVSLTSNPNAPGVTGAALELVRFFLYGSESSRTYGPFAYDEIEPSWRKELTVSADYSIESGGDRIDVYSGWSRRFVLGVDDLSVLQPQMEPPGLVTVDGASAWSAPTGVGVTPTIEWTAPAVAPDMYEVDLYTAERQWVARLFLRGTSLRVPPGLLTPGARYYAEIAALSDPLGLDSAAPYLHETDSFYAGSIAKVLTGPFSP